MMTSWPRKVATSRWQWPMTILMKNSRDLDGKDRSASALFWKEGYLLQASQMLRNDVGQWIFNGAVKPMRWVQFCLAPKASCSTARLLVVERNYFSPTCSSDSYEPVWLKRTGTPLGPHFSCRVKHQRMSRSRNHIQSSQFASECTSLASELTWSARPLPWSHRLLQKPENRRKQMDVTSSPESTKKNDSDLARNFFN